MLGDFLRHSVDRVDATALPGVIVVTAAIYALLRGVEISVQMDVEYGEPGAGEASIRDRTSTPPSFRSSRRS